MQILPSWGTRRSRSILSKAVQNLAIPRCCLAGRRKCAYTAKKKLGSGGIRTHASEETGALDHSATLADIEDKAILISLHFIKAGLVVAVDLHREKIHRKILKEKHFMIDKT